jgi:hypothetical protein
MEFLGITASLMWLLDEEEDALAKRQRLKYISRHSPGLHNLAPLPTATPESAGLCALGVGSIVVRSLNVQ